MHLHFTAESPDQDGIERKYPGPPTHQSFRSEAGGKISIEPSIM